MSHIMGYLEGGPPSRVPLKEAISILEGLPPTPELAIACADMANGLVLEAIPDSAGYAERALALSRELGLPRVTVKALGAAGLGIYFAGDPQRSLDAMGEALELARHAGLGHETALIYNNSSVTTWSVEGPGAALRLCEEGLRFAETRGFGEIGSALRSTRHSFLYDLGRWPESARTLPDDISIGKARGDRWVLVELLAYDRRIRLYRGLPPSSEDDPLELATSLGLAEMIVLNLVIAATDRAIKGDRDHAHDLIASLPRIHEQTTWHIADHLAEVARVVAAVDDGPLLASLLESVPRFALRHEVAGSSASAILGELLGDWQTALDGHRRAAEGWHGYGSVVEEAHAWFGVHRCASRQGLADEASAALETAEGLIEPLDAPNFTALLGPDIAEGGVRRPAASG